MKLHKFDPKRPITALTCLEGVSPEIFSFEQQCDNWSKTLNIKKIAQGSYATILRTQKRDDPDVYTIVKLVPLRPLKGKGSRRKDHMSIDDAVAETKALAAMAAINGFVEFRIAHVLTGVLPSLIAEIQSAWEQDHPDDVADLKHEKDQLWLLMEMTDAGTDLETLLGQGFPDGTFLNSDEEGKKVTAFQTWDIFWGVAEALARAEQIADFEHRDLHPGNVCIRRAQDVSEASVCDNIGLIKRFTDLRVTMIDYTLSRANTSGNAEGEVLANSMRDASVFEQHSDNEIDERQYETYRRMKEMVMYQDSRGNRENKWKAFVPATNLLWLQHLLVVLLRQTATARDLGKRLTELPKEDSHRLMDVLEAIRDDFDPPLWKKWRCQSVEDLVVQEINNAENQRSEISEIEVRSEDE